MTDSSLTSRISELIGETLLIDPPAADADLIESGLIDSLALVNLIAEIEAELGVKLPLDELEIERFRTARLIADSVAGLIPDDAA